MSAERLTLNDESGAVVGAALLGCEAGGFSRRRRPVALTASCGA